MIEPITVSINNKWRISKAKTTALMCVIGFFLSVIFTTGAGIYFLEILDHFITNFGLVTIGLLECIIFGWLFRVNKLRDHANETSDILLGKWWDYVIKYIIPSVLIVLLIVAIINNLISNPYSNYPLWLIVFMGILPLLIITIASILLMKIKNTKEKLPK